MSRFTVEQLDTEQDALLYRASKRALRDFEDIFGRKPDACRRDVPLLLELRSQALRAEWYARRRLMDDE